MTQTKVRFIGERQGVLSLLEVEAATELALFEVLTRALFALRVQIVRAESRRIDASRRRERLWVVEFDGAPIRLGRRFVVQSEVLRAVEDARLGATSVQARQYIECIDNFNHARPLSLES